ncbi:MAG: antibiotic biosynthesis monooxygenase, partial [Sphingomicrobium sp.]
MSPAILIARFHVRPGAESEFADWQAQALTRAAGFDGFANSELTPATESDSAWTISLRFCDLAKLEEWRNSTQWHGLVGEAQHFLTPDTAVEIEAKEAGADGGVVEVIVTKVKPGMEAAYRQWETKIQQAQSKFPGYKGSYVQPPI